MVMSMARGEEGCAPSSLAAGGHLACVICSRLCTLYNGVN